jgi:hypothetical protein
VYLLLSCGRLEAAWVPPAVDAAFRSRDTPLDVAWRLLYGPFGASRGSQAKWARFRRAGSAAHIPERARDVVDFVAAGLRPAFAALGLSAPASGPVTPVGGGDIIEP